jgi:hypothetical protein
MTSAIPWTAPVAPPSHGLLNTPGDVLAGWLFAFVSVMAVVLVMAHFRDTARALWRPWGAWLARLHVAVAGLVVFIALFVLEAPVWLENISLDLWRWGREQLRRLAYMGFWPPILT